MPSRGLVAQEIPPEGIIYETLQDAESSILPTWYHGALAWNKDPPEDNNGGYIPVKGRK